MQNILNKTLTLIVIIGFILLTAFLIMQNATRVGASVGNDSSGYQATTTPSATSTSGVLLLKTGHGILGSVVVTGGPRSGTITLYDATTSNSNLRTGNIASSTIYITDFPAGVASSTYVFDVEFKTGLLMSVAGNPSTTTITFK